MTVLETAGELYREIRARGLELRRGNGRDDALYTALWLRLGCGAERSLQRFLDNSSISAQEFLRHFLSLAVPFARMFQEIWAYLASTVAPRVSEEIRVRFGFDEKGIDIDLRQFREYADVTADLESLTALQWPEAANNALFTLARILLDCEEGVVTDWQGYVPSLQHNLPQILRQTHPCDRIAAAIRSYLRALIAVVEEDPTRGKRMPRHWDLHVFLSDILPWWYRLLSEWANLDEARKDRGVRYYEEEIQPLFEASREDNIRKALDILRLPFWEHRWHTYEIWLTVLTLRSLAHLHPVPRVRSGHLAIDTQDTRIIADLAVEGHPLACIVTQMETPFVSGDRKAIKPDISICFDDRLQADSRAVVVEAKQRQTLAQRHLTDVGKAYKEGSPRASGVLFVNYDASGTLTEQLAGVSLVTELTPAQPTAITAYQEALSDYLNRAGMSALKCTFVLIDVSGSMHDKYDSASVKRDLALLLRFPGTTGFRFSDQLLDSDGIPSGTGFSATPHGGTDISIALDQVIERHGEPDFLVVITDGGFSADPRVQPSETCFVCDPSEVTRAIAWRTAGSTF